MTTYILSILPKPSPACHTELREQNVTMAPVEIHTPPRYVGTLLRRVTCRPVRPGPFRLSCSWIVLRSRPLALLRSSETKLPANYLCSLLPTGVLGSHIALIGYLSVVAVRSIYRSYLALPPSSATRYREPLRRGHVQTFAILAIVSLVVGGVYGSKFGSLSYRVWATERGVELPERSVPCSFRIPQPLYRTA